MLRKGIKKIMDVLGTNAGEPASKRQRVNETGGARLV